MEILPRAGLLVFSAVGFSMLLTVPSIVTSKYEQKEPSNDFMEALLLAMKELYLGYLILTLPFLISSFFILVYLKFSFPILGNIILIILAITTLFAVLLTFWVYSKALVDTFFNVKKFIHLKIED